MRLPSAEQPEPWSFVLLIALFRAASTTSAVSSMTIVARAALATGDLRIVHTETFGMHYARTGEEWLKNIRRHKEQIIRAYSEEFFRVYEYSWLMGAAAFETGMTLLHVVFEKRPYGSDYRESIVSW